MSQDIVIHQESHVSVVAEEEWSNVGFDISKASEKDEREKGEEEVRGEKESRELKRTGERPSKVSTMISLSLSLSLSVCVWVCVRVCCVWVWVCMCVSVWYPTMLEDGGLQSSPLSCPRCHPFLPLLW